MATLAKLEWVFSLSVLCQRLASHPPLFFKLKVVLEDSSGNHSVSRNHGFMERSHQERQPRPTKAIRLDKSPDPALCLESFTGIYSFAKLWGMWNTQPGGILALRGTGCKAFPPGLDSEPSVGPLSPDLRGDIWPLCFLCLIEFILSYLIQRADNSNSHHFLSAYHI